jgi:uncharacterized RDD family membrane protein YckC
VVLELPIAGPTSRILAYAVDAILMVSLTFAAFFLLLTIGSAVGWLGDLVSKAAEEFVSDPARPAPGRYGMLLMAVAIAAQLAIELFYFVFFETVWRGRSPGKRLLGLGVTRSDGLPVSFGASLVRNLLRAVDVLPTSYITGLVSMLVTPRTQRLGDLAGDTVVIRYDRPQVATPVLAAGDGDPHVVFPREQLARLGSDERQLLRQTLRRIEALPPEEAEALAARAARALAQRMGGEAPLPDGAAAHLRALHARIRRTRSAGP